ncbi:MAG: HIT domain-containing protein [Asgard group archaeon]|jgi:diadenosine tetraphosphate (Ap4A) HIT family hydrolase|nr:HIT domain-containing protein [Asgard group archaeon]|tara:strand:- start:317 stop:715 length:399 start_codon:yes stop_codon:yes gene_type:complete
MYEQDCIFCKIVNEEIPSIKIYETENIYGFMDIFPLNDGHCLFIPKQHSVTMDETSDLALSEILIAIKKVAKKLNIKNYNILQNNGSIAHQQVMHTHFHLIPKDDTHGLQIVWDPKPSVNQEEIAKLINSKD